MSMMMLVLVILWLVKFNLIIILNFIFTCAVDDCKNLFVYILDVILECAILSRQSTDTYDFHLVVHP